MNYGIISDIHSNFEALSVVIEELSRRETQKILCLGDVVGYGANPNESCDLIREICDCVVMGNHDAGSVGVTRLSYFNREAARACIWTARVLSPENRNWLKELPFMVENECSLIVHSTPSNPRNWEYIFTLGDAAMEFKSMDFKLCFVGHSHCPAIFMSHNGEYSIIQNSRVTLTPGARYIINPGSVGQPRDSNPRASFAIYDSSKNEIEIVRLSYDIMRVQEKILDAKLPEVLAYRLAVGR